MKTFISVFAAGVVVALATGCNNSNNSTASAPSTNAAMDYGNTLVNSKKTADKTIDVSYINQAIQLYGTQEGHLPKTLQDLVPNYIAKIPDAPLSYTLTYDATKGEAKMVPQ